jgi:hypothetical protein
MPPFLFLLAVVAPMVIPFRRSARTDGPLVDARHSQAACRPTNRDSSQFCGAAFVHK